MAPKKASVGDRTAQFLAQLGTGGGAIGSPSLFTFGASDLAQQVQAGNINEYAAIQVRSADPKVGNPNSQPSPMPRDLDSSYLKLNLPGSPLPRNGLLAPNFIDSAQFTQDAIIANEQAMMLNFLPLRGQLPVGIQPPVPQKKGRR